MKNILLILTCLCVLFSCSSKENTARKLIEESLKKSMNDWSSYEFVDMKQLDSTFTTFSGSDEGTKLYRESNEIDTKLMIFKINLDYPENYTEERYNEMKDSVQILENNKSEIDAKYKELKDNFKKEHDGFYTDFTFRGNNKMGSKVINKIRYMFNKDLTAIVYQRNLTTD